MQLETNTPTVGEGTSHYLREMPAFKTYQYLYRETKVLLVGDGAQTLSTIVLRCMINTHLAYIRLYQSPHILYVHNRGWKQNLSARGRSSHLELELHIKQQLFNTKYLKHGTLPTKAIQLLSDAAPSESFAQYPSACDW